LTQQCTVTAFGVGFYCRVLQDGKCVMINLISHVTEEKSASFTLNIVIDVFRNLDPTYLPYSVICTDRLITYTYGSTARSKFIYTETEDAFFLPFVKTFLKFDKIL